MANSSARSVVAKLATAADGGVLSLEAAVATLHGDRRSTARRLGALVRAGWLSRLRRGVYSIRPLEAMPGLAMVEEDPWIVATQIFAPCYIGGWTAAGHWQLTEQLFRSTFVATARAVRRADVTVGGSAFHITHRARVKGAGVETVWRGRTRVGISSVELTVVDACVRPSSVGGGRQLVDIFRAAAEDARMAPEKLVKELRRGATGAALGRIGVLTERYWPDATSVLHYVRAHRGTGYVRLDPKIRANGRLLRRWGVWVNVVLPEGAR